MRALYAAAALAGPVLALPVPPRSGAERPESCASVRLLRDRAVAVRPDFELDRTTRPR